eukprot:39011_1
MSTKSGVFEWAIDSRLLNTMLNARNGWHYESKVFRIADIPFQLEVYPNGRTKEQIGYFLVYVDIVSWPTWVESMFVCKSQYCSVTGSHYTCIVKYSQNANCIGHPTTLSLLSEIRYNTLPLYIGTSINILQININQNATLYNIFNGAVTNMLYIQTLYKQQIVWHIDKTALKKCGSAHYGKCFESHIIDNQWVLQCYPNGVIKKKKGHVQVFLQLCGLPPSVPAIRVKYKIRCIETKAEFSGKAEYGYDNACYGDKLMKLSDMVKYKSVTLVADIETLSFDDYQEEKSNDVNDEPVEEEMKQSDEVMNRLDIVERKHKETTELLTVQIASLAKELETKGTLISSLTKQLQERTMTVSKLETQQKQLKSFIFEESKNNDSDANITNITSELLSLKQEMQKMKIIMSNMQNQNKPHTSEAEKLRAWLKDTVKLEQYFDMFIENGFDNLEAIKMVTMDVLNMIGIDKI